MNQFKKNSLFILIIFCGVIASKIIFAQSLPQFATNLNIQNTEANAGDIISENNGELFLANKPYDQNVVGVVGEIPTLVFGKPNATSTPIIYFGDALIKVSNSNGEIKKGDFIASSEKAGIGQKATQSGFMVAEALQNFNQEEGLIMAKINIQYVDINEIDVQTRSMFSKIIQKLTGGSDLLRYLFAILLGIGSFLIGFFHFMKTLQKGLEAIGRNPLAKNTIRLTMLLNLTAVAILTCAGVGLALLIIFY